ncbi:hypothetical protein F5882DRAFT_438774 [Hyaloscypha sp. PMI_1271]|nr:hypothetical protein F5882DRAFT_438774 [Hyaloscypha sp. PMI_1271]
MPGSRFTLSASFPSSFTSYHPIVDDNCLHPSRHPLAHAFSPPFDKFNDWLAMQASGIVRESYCKGYEFLRISGEPLRTPLRVSTNFEPFPKFRQLPLRIQDLVWDHASKAQGRFRIHAGGETIFGRADNREILALLHTCVQSRKAALRYFVPRILVSSPTTYTVEWVDLANDIFTAPAPHSWGLRLVLSGLDFCKIRKLAIEFKYVYRPPGPFSSDDTCHWLATGRCGECGRSFGLTGAVPTILIAELYSSRPPTSPPVLRSLPIATEPSHIICPFLPIEISTLLARIIKDEHPPQDFFAFRSTNKAWKAATDQIIGAEGLVIPCLKGIEDDIKSTLTPDLKNEIRTISFISGPLATFKSSLEWEIFAKLRSANFQPRGIRICRDPGRPFRYQRAQRFLDNYDMPRGSRVLKRILKDFPKLQTIRLGMDREWKKSGRLCSVYKVTDVEPFAGRAEISFRDLFLATGSHAGSLGISTIFFKQEMDFDITQFGSPYKGTKRLLSRVENLEIVVGQGTAPAGAPKPEFNQMSVLLGHFAGLENLIIRCQREGRIMQKDTFFAGPSKFGNFLGKRTWPRLHTIYISGVTCLENDLVSFMIRHRATLRHLGLGDIELVSGSWESFFDNFRQEHHTGNNAVDCLTINGQLMKYLCKAFIDKRKALQRLGDFILRLDFQWPFGRYSNFNRHDGADWRDEETSDMGGDVQVVVGEVDNEKDRENDRRTFELCFRRVDHKVKFENATQKQIEELFKRMYTTSTKVVPNGTDAGEKKEDLGEEELSQIAKEFANKFGGCFLSRRDPGVFVEAEEGAEKGPG